MGTKRMKRTNIPILTVGDSGSGKSSMFGILLDDKNNVKHYGLPPEKTIIINIEDKEVPTINAGEFSQKTVYNLTELMQLIDGLISLKTLTNEEKEKINKMYKEDKKNNPLNKEFIVFDSITAITGLINTYCNIKYTGFKIWNNYNLLIEQIVAKFKQLPMQTFVTAIPEQKEEALGDIKNYAKVKGKELKFGYIESQFTIVLWTKPVLHDTSKEVLDVEITFVPNSENTAKSPTGMFAKPLVNDAYKIAKDMERYYAKAKQVEWQDTV